MFGPSDFVTTAGGIIFGLCPGRKNARLPFERALEFNSQDETERTRQVNKWSPAVIIYMYIHTYHTYIRTIHTYRTYMHFLPSSLQPYGFVGGYQGSNGAHQATNDDRRFVNVGQHQRQVIGLPLPRVHIGALRSGIALTFKVEDII